MVHIGDEHGHTPIQVRSAKSCKMACACDLDMVCGKEGRGDVTCYPGLVWNRSSCLCEPIQPRKACTGKSTSNDDENKDTLHIPIHLFVFSLVAELLLVVAVAFCFTNLDSCRKRTRQFSRQVSLASRQMSRQLSVPVGGVVRQHSVPLILDGQDFRGSPLDDCEGGGFAAGFTSIK